MDVDLCARDFALVDGSIAAGIAEAAAYRVSFWAAAILTLAGAVLLALRVPRRPPNAEGAGSGP